jgi:hypothetical protein
VCPSVRHPELRVRTPSRPTGDAPTFDKGCANGRLAVSE